MFCSVLSTEYDKRLMWKIVKDRKGFSNYERRMTRSPLKCNVATRGTSDRAAESLINTDPEKFNILFMEIRQK